MSNIEMAAQWVKQDGLVPIIRGDFGLDRMLAIADTLRAHGLTVLEVTLNSTGALEAIAALRQRHASAMLIGAGTVRTPEQVDAALDAGAQFLVSPNFDPASVRRALTRDSLHLPGVFTPTEAETAFRAGCRILKLFPADVVGPAYLKALRAPLNDIEFIPTGGVSAENVAAYVKAGAVAVGIGGALIAGPQQPLDDVAARAQALRRAWSEARHG